MFLQIAGFHMGYPGWKPLKLVESFVLGRARFLETL
jgi:hypothetical protein